MPALFMSVLYLISIDMSFVVTYSVFACDDGIAERVTRHFTDFFTACDYFAECNETESDCTISVEQLEEDDDDLPF